MNDFILLCKTVNPFEASLIKTHLENEDILCFINTNDASGTLPHLGFVEGGAEIFVHKDDFEKSQKILNEMNEES